MYGDVSPMEFEAMAERLAEMNVQCTVVTEQERERMGEMLFLMCRDIPNLVKIGGGRPSTIMHTAMLVRSGFFFGVVNQVREFSKKWKEKTKCLC